MVVFKIDYKKFRGWLRQKYNPSHVYLFIGFMPSRAKFYQHLEESGYTLVYKETVSVAGVVKGNCDAELILTCISNFYTKAFSSCYLLTGDGDFGCLVEFLGQQEAISGVLSPNMHRCSFLLRNKATEITFLNEHYHKFATEIQKEKAPDADVSA